ncbi:Gfo/Idh/MocA family oxidoreductase [candidate division KSB1 bacterium]|nr:Gfo/Idh/MocA family oxidoreductase [candidate division KSB1 bacterium]
MQEKKENSSINRRQFLGGLAAASAFTIVPRHVLGGAAGPAPSDKLNIAGIGVGGMGKENLKNMATENIVALADVDWEYAREAFETYPDARRYKDFRLMLEEQKDVIDAVLIATPDHTHAVASVAAMQLGKHVYTQKPLTHTVYEARVLADMAKEKKLITQMGNQGHSGEDIRLETEWLQDGAIGDVTEVHIWTDRPVWPQGIYKRPEQMELKKGLDWDLWLGPMRFRAYNEIYHPFRWRGWWDFGTGALGDMGCHFIDHPWTALKLTYPTSVNASFCMDFTDEDIWQKLPLDETFPKASIVTYNFGARDNMPALKLIWYDGGLQPPRPDELEPRRRMPTNGALYIGSKGKLLQGDDMVRLIPESAMKAYTIPEKRIPRIEISHEQNWIQAIKENKPASADFSYAGPLAESVLLGNIALKFPYEVIEYDPVNMVIKGNDAATAMLKMAYRKGWSL